MWREGCLQLQVLRIHAEPLFFPIRHDVMVLSSPCHALRRLANTAASFCRSSTVAAFVVLECDGLPGTLSDNAFLLLPWEPEERLTPSQLPHELADLETALNAVSLGNMWRQ